MAGKRAQKPPKTGARRGGGAWMYGLISLAVLAGALLVFTHRPTPPGQLSEFPFPCSPEETLARHVHPWLRIVVNGQEVQIPAFIGILDPRPGLPQGCLEPVHTHDTSGIIHIESPDMTTTYTLGDFFKIWQVTYGSVDVAGQARPVVYTPDELLGFKADAGHSVTLLVDGSPSSEGPGLDIGQLDYCTAQDTGPPCSPTAAGDPQPDSLFRQYGGHHTIVLEYGPKRAG